MAVGPAEPTRKLAPEFAWHRAPRSTQVDRGRTLRLEPGGHVLDALAELARRGQVAGTISSVEASEGVAVIKTGITASVGVVAVCDSWRCSA